MDQALEHTLLEQSRQGDAAAFSALIKPYQQPLFRVAFRLLGNTEEAKDAVQETLLKVWQKLDSFDPDRSFEAWLFAVISHHCYDVLQSLRYRLRKVSLDKVITRGTGTTPEDAYVNKELAAELNRLLDKLSPKQRLVFVLKEIEQLDTVQLTTMTGLTGDQIKSNLCQAKKKLRNHLMNTVK
ncbi:MAG: sigma-70 family RNA polymerase sigma factor [Bacteroidales bacterium]|jgi:RNA polymerase sigma-70 factor, ECF subfamily|nr:sigma-70 family RNA polymerase sigma factor [Bacteroidales bacterium]